MRRSRSSDLELRMFLYVAIFEAFKMGFFFRLFFYGTILSLTGLYLMKVIEFADPFKVVHNHLPGKCSLVPGIEHGSEDVDVLPSGMAIISTGLQFGKPKDGISRGAMKYFNFSDPEQPPKELKITGFKGQLNPHGLSIFTESGKVYVYVINHPPFNLHPPDDVVEKFLWEVEKRTLIHQKTFSDPEFIGLNNLVVVGQDKFYTTNVQISKSLFLAQLELVLFHVPLQTVIYFDGKNGTIVLSGRYAPNGIDVSPDNKYLYLAEVNKKRITSFRIESPTKLVQVDSNNLGSVPDNINVDPVTGNLWIGCHPIGYRLLQKIFQIRHDSPSQVIRVGVNDGKFTKTAELYSDDGLTLSGSSVAAHFKGALLIGTFDHKMIYCKCASC